MGRKSSINQWLKPDALKQLTAWAADGQSDYTIAAHMGVSRSTLTRFKRDNDAIDAAIKNGRKQRREIMSSTAEDALLKRLNGCYVTETETTTITSPDGSTTVKTTEKSRYIAPSDTCIIFTLKKLLPKVYGDNADTDDNEAWRDEVAAAIRGEPTSIDPLSVAFYRYEAENGSLSAVKRADEA